MVGLLILKLTIVPLGLLLFGVVERLHGPRIAGWLAGFPMVAGPLLVFVALEQGARFGSQAALGAYFGLVPWLAFALSYAACTRWLNALWCTVIAFAAWALAASASVVLQNQTRWLEIVPLAAFLAAVLWYPRGEPSDEEREHSWWAVPARMAAGAVLTVLITRFAAAMGTHWSGVFTTFPVMGSIVCISSQLQYGRHAVTEAVAGMTLGLASVGTFCFAAYLMLGHITMWVAFALSLVASSTAHAATWLWFKHKA
jgi:hypothetical protein